MTSNVIYDLHENRLFLSGRALGLRGVAGVASATPYFGIIRIGSNKKIN